MTGTETIRLLRIETSRPKTLIGMRLGMTLASDRTPELWRSFMPRRAEVQHREGAAFLNVRVFADSPRPAAPDAPFERWAAVEVWSADDAPPGMEALELPGGLYAVFLHRGPASAAAATFEYIFRTWLPSSGFSLDDRPHFEILPPGYRPDRPDAEEEIWIPIRPSGDGDPAPPAAP